tara:strand:+ start:276 stop:515 length:240 start_codon:yes stop_codon:yes gene_type:complete
MSSKGQVVIPEDVRKKMKLDKGTQFAVISEGDVILLKLLTPPSLSQFDNLVKKVRDQVRESGLEQSDLENLIDESRSKS